MSALRSLTGCRWLLVVHGSAWADRQIGDVALDGFLQRLKLASQVSAHIASVDFQGWYYGYDENGNTKRLDWHGYTKSRLPVATDLDPARIERAELNVLTWAGGAGTVKEYFKLNGVHYPVAEGSRHELIYSRLPVNPATLKRGLNRIELLPDTEHHSIEIIYPGPALLVRYRN